MWKHFLRCHSLHTMLPWHFPILVKNTNSWYIGTLNYISKAANSLSQACISTWSHFKPSVVAWLGYLFCVPPRRALKNLPQIMKKVPFSHYFYSIKKFGICHTDMRHTSKKIQEWCAMTFLSQRSDGFRNIWIKASRKSPCYPIGGFSDPGAHEQPIHHNVHPEEMGVCVKFQGPQSNGPQKTPKKLKKSP